VNGGDDRRSRGGLAGLACMLVVGAGFVLGVAFPQGRRSPLAGGVVAYVVAFGLIGAAVAVAARRR
jgi:hypothetical protein